MEKLIEKYEAMYEENSKNSITTTSSYYEDGIYMGKKEVLWQIVEDLKNLNGSE